MNPANKLTKEVFIERSNIKHNKIYNYSLVEYKNILTHVTIICDIHGEFKQIPNAHLNGSGCPKCGSLKKGSSQVLNKEIFIQKSILIHGNKYDYSLVEYVNAKTKVNIICPEHGVFKQTPGKHLFNQACPECGRYIIENSRRSNKEEFISKAQLIHGKKYDYKDVSYVNNKTKVKINCPEHGIWEQKPNHHLLGKGCRKCSGSDKLTTAIFIIRSNKKHNNKYDYSLTNYTDHYGKVDIVCAKHGIFNQTAGSHLAGIGCPNCKRSKGEEVISDFLNKSGILFESQKTFDGCVLKNKLQFDFYIPIYNMCIEFDGAQHYVSVEHFGGESELKTRQKRDSIKTAFCQSNGIQLVRIKYDENILDRLKSLF